MDAPAHKASMKQRVSTTAATALALAVATVGCAGVLGLDSGVADDEAGTGDGTAAEGEGAAPDSATPTDHASGQSNDVVGAPDGATPAADASRTDSTAPDGGCAYVACTDGCCSPVTNGVPVCTGTGACGHVCDQGYVDCASAACSCGGGQRCLSDDTCGACRSPLQPCHLGTDCCSGTCGAGSTCL